MKLKLGIKKIFQADLEADVERVVEKGMEINSKKLPKKTRYQIRQEEKRKNEELKHKHEMQNVFIGIGLLFGVPLLIVIVFLILDCLGMV